MVDYKYFIDTVIDTLSESLNDRLSKLHQLKIWLEMRTDFPNKKEIIEDIECEMERIVKKHIQDVSYFKNKNFN